MEGRRLSDSVDSLQRAVNLQLVCGDLFIAQGSGATGFDNQASDIVKQRADLAQGAISRLDDLASSLRVTDGFV